MSKRDAIYEDFSENGYPDAPIQKKEFAARFLGARLVGAMDSVLDDKIALLNGTGNDSYQELIECLATLNGDQRSAVERLLKDTCASFFYWMLVKLRDFPDCVELNVMQYNEEDDSLKKICDVADEIELHHRYFDWMEEFSDHIDEP